MPISAVVAGVGAIVGAGATVYGANKNAQAQNHAADLNAQAQQNAQNLNYQQWQASRGIGANGQPVNSKLPLWMTVPASFGKSISSMAPTVQPVYASPQSMATFGGSAAPATAAAPRSFLVRKS